MLYFLLSCMQFIGLFASALSGEVCYGKYGCFNNNPPFNRYIDVITKIVPLPLPQSPVDVGTTFHLVSKNNSEVIDDSDSAKLQASKYDGSKKTVIIVHGWTGSLESPWIKVIKPALLDKEDVNLIITDWKKGAAKIYTTSVANTRLVGAQVAELIKFLNQQTNNSPASFHMIGFSLGAHVVGYAGRRLKQVKVGRITGLDPAGPYYHNQPADVRLDETDAEFVDAIHTDGGVLQLGMMTRSGRFDFYPNNGIKQRGCEGIACDHFRAPAYYIESIASQCPFRSYRCSSWDQFTRGNCFMTCESNSCPEMGHNAINYKALAGGSFYLYTNKQQPFCVHRYVHVTFKTKSSFLGGGRNPMIRIYDTKGDSGNVELEKRDLAAGSTERFVAPIKMDLGTLTSISVWNQLGSLLDGWKLDKVTFNYVDNTDCSYTAIYNMWLKTTPVNKPLAQSGSNC